MIRRLWRLALHLGGVLWALTWRERFALVGLVVAGLVLGMAVAMGHRRPPRSTPTPRRKRTHARR